MSIEWADGFDHYGTTSSLLLQSGYVTANGITVGDNSANARTGTGYAIFGSSPNLCRALNTAVDTLGIGTGVRWLTTPSATLNANRGLMFNTAITTVQFRVVINTNLGISVLNNANVTLGSSANNIVSLLTWYWIEAKAIKNSGTNTNDGSIEVRLNGVTVLTVTGVNLNNQWTHAALGNSGGSSGSSIWADDFVIWNGLGTSNNDFIGNRRCVTSFVNADEATQDWTPATGTDGYAMLDNNPPVDTDYVNAATAGDISEFQKQAIGVDTNDIAAIVVAGRAWKTDAGAATYRLGIHSGATVSNSSTINPDVTASMSRAIFELDPNGNIPWTKANADAATLRITRDT